MTDRNVEQHSLGRTVVLHLFPGVLITLFFAVTAPFVVAAGYPSLVALLLAILFVAIPVELGYLLYQARKAHGTNSLEGVVVYRQPIPIWQYFALVIPLILWAGVAFTFSGLSDEMLTDLFFRGLPDWYFFDNFAASPSDYTRSALMVTVVLSLLLNGIAAPIAEEMYFRGYLLPRISRFEGWAPAINTALFSLYNFWSPWQLLTRFFAILPLVTVVYWKKNIYVGMLARVLLNTIGALLTAGLIFSQI